MKKRPGIPIYNIIVMGLEMPVFRAGYLNLMTDIHSPFRHISDRRWLQQRLRFLKQVASYAESKNPAIYRILQNYIRKLEAYQRRPVRRDRKQ